MVKRNKVDKKPHLDQDEFRKLVSRKVMEWASTCFRDIILSLYTTTTSTPTPGILGTAPTETLEALIRRMLTPGSSPDKSTGVETWEDKLGMSSTELKTTLLMCGLEEGK